MALMAMTTAALFFSNANMTAAPTLLGQSSPSPQPALRSTEYNDGTEHLIAQAPPSNQTLDEKTRRLQGAPTYLQGGSQSNFLQTGMQSNLLQTGTQSNLLQTGTQSNLLQGGTAGTLIQGNVEHMGGPANILFLLDCSYSMKEKLGHDGVPKMKAAKEVLRSAMQRIPSDVNVGLRIFGQGFNGIMDIDCRQTVLLVPLGTGNRGSIYKRMESIEAFGLTPLEYALRQCAEDDFRGCQGSKTIILISDGTDTCGGDPCAFIQVLPRYGIKIKCDVVGLELKNDKKARNELDCIAKTSGGKYYDANTAGELIESVSRSVDAAIQGRVLPKSSVPAKNVETIPETTPTPDLGPATPPYSTPR
jgi:Ca-activated chloride channel family protein